MFEAVHPCGLSCRLSFVDPKAALYQTPEASRETPLDLIDRWLIRAADALASAWDGETGNFWRDSLRGDSDASDHDTSAPLGLGRGKGATSNNRAFQAAVSLCYFLSENDDIPLGRTALADFQIIVREMVYRYFSRDIQDLRGHGENQQNVYTDSQLVLSLCLTLSPTTELACHLELDADLRSRLLRNLLALVEDLVSNVGDEGVKVHPKAVPHHFLTLHAVRALDAASRTLEMLDPEMAAKLREPLTSSQLMEHVRTETVQQLGLHLMPSPGFDSSSLLSCCALVSRFTGDAESPIIAQAVDALVAEQSDRGTWTSAGVLSFGRRRLVYIPSVELSLVLANLTLFDLRADGIDLFESSRPALDSSFKLVQSSFLRSGEASGWRNDRTLSGYEVESWTTAVVLQFLIAYRESLFAARQERVLRKYRASRPAAQFADFWPDLDRLIPSSDRASRLRDGAVTSSAITKFVQTTDPTENNSLVNGIHDEIILPTLTGLCERPVDTASFLLYGPPGTLSLIHI